MSAVRRSDRSRRRGRKVNGKVKVASIFAVIIGVVALLVYFGVLPSAGHVPPSNQQMVLHIHPRLEIVVDGKAIIVPSSIGISSNLWKNHTLDTYGMTGMAPLHSHDTQGIIHVESNTNRNYTLGQLFDVWGVPFSQSCILDKCSSSESVSVLIDGVGNTEFRSHVLKDGELIHIEFKSSS